MQWLECVVKVVHGKSKTVALTYGAGYRGSTCCSTAHNLQVILILDLQVYVEVEVVYSLPSSRTHCSNVPTIHSFDNYSCMHFIITLMSIPTSKQQSRILATSSVQSIVCMLFLWNRMGVWMKYCDLKRKAIKVASTLQLVSLVGSDLTSHFYSVSIYHDIHRHNKQHMHYHDTLQYTQ